MLAAIPYQTFPEIELGPLTLRTFGLFVGLGVVLGTVVAARHLEGRAGIARDETYRMATWLVLAGVVGSRLTWVVTHFEDVDSPVDVIAVWQGGLQFSGGFVAGLLVAVPAVRRFDRAVRAVALDGYALGLALGVGIGRIGCYAVGEHFGRTTDFFLATRYEGGDVREPTLGDLPLVEGTTFHNTSLYEFGYLLLLFAVLALLTRRRAAPGTLVGVFCAVYGVARFASDTLRVNDDRVAGMTGAQWMCIALVLAGAWVLWRVRRRPVPAAGPAPAARAAEAQRSAAATEAPEATEA